jgi:phosphate-selective porin OprO/OprP
MMLTGAFSLLNAQQGVNEISFGKGLLNYVAKDNTFSVKFAPRFQSRFNTVWSHDGSEYGDAKHSFLVRRARLKFSGWAYSPKLKYKLEISLSNKDLGGANSFTNNAPRQLLDAVIMWNFAPNWSLWAGQTKLPGNIERVVSSSSLQFIDRSILNSKFNLDRDTGIQLHHKSTWGSTIVTKEKFALSQGEGRNVTTGNLGGLQYTARFELLPFGEFTKKGDYFESDLQRESNPKLMLGYTYNLNNDAVKTRSGSGSYMTIPTGFYQTNITTAFVDLVFKYRGWSVLSEIAERSAESPIVTQADGIPTGDIVNTGQAVNAQIGYLFNNNVEVAGRFSSINYDNVVGKASPKQYTLGVSKYIVGHKLKVQADLTKSVLDDQDEEVMLRTGFEFHF